MSVTHYWSMLCSCHILSILSVCLFGLWINSDWPTIGVIVTFFVGQVAIPVIHFVCWLTFVLLIMPQRNKNIYSKLFLMSLQNCSGDCGTFKVLVFDFMFEKQNPSCLWQIVFRKRVFLIWLVGWSGPTIYLYIEYIYPHRFILYINIIYIICEWD